MRLQMLAIIGVLEALYAVVSKESETNEGLTGYKTKLIQTDNEKTGISYRVQAAKLRHSVCRTFSKHRMTNCVKWTDSTTNSHLIKKKNGPCKPTVNNQVNMDNELDYTSLRHIATLLIPAYIRNREYFSKKLCRKTDSIFRFS